MYNVGAPFVAGVVFIEYFGWNNACTLYEVTKFKGNVLSQIYFYHKMFVFFCRISGLSAVKPVEPTENDETNWTTIETQFFLLPFYFIFISLFFPYINLVDYSSFVLFGIIENAATTRVNTSDENAHVSSSFFFSFEHRRYLQFGASIFHEPSVFTNIRTVLINEHLKNQTATLPFKI